MTLDRAVEIVWSGGEVGGVVPWVSEMIMILVLMVSEELTVVVVAVRLLFIVVGVVGVAEDDERISVVAVRDGLLSLLPAAVWGAVVGIVGIETLLAFCVACSS